jgi:phosphate transport system ATP-binding protein
VLEFRSTKLNAWFGKTQALQEINMTVAANHATAVIGPSGCGKSTFVRCLNRMHETIPEARATGRVRIGDMDVYNGSSATHIRRRIGMVFQKPNPFPTMSIYDNVAAGLKLNGFRDRKRLDEIVERSLTYAALFTEVKDTMHKKSGASLSGGQQQRLCIARALAVEPQVLLMDEPCSALDPISTGKIEELIFQLKERFTIVIVTHNMQQASAWPNSPASLAGQADRIRQDRKNLHQSIRQTDGRLHHRQVWINTMRRPIPSGTRRTTSTLTPHGRTGRAGSRPRLPGLHRP